MLQRTIEEWLTVAKISRGVGHLFFEGRSDARIFYHLAGYPTNVDFRSAEEISDDLDSYSPLVGGYKSRLLRLAKQADVVQLENLLCVADADFGVLVSHLAVSDNLLETKYANTPASVLTYDWLQGLLLKAYGFSLNEHTWGFLEEVLPFAFVARFFSATSKHPHAAPDLASFVQRKKQVFQFDRFAYILKFFQTDRKRAQSLLESVQSYTEWLEFEVRHLINSNDLFSLIYTLLRKTGCVSGSTPRETLRQAYFAAFNCDVDGAFVPDRLGEWLCMFSTDDRHTEA